MACERFGECQVVSAYTHAILIHVVKHSYKILRAIKTIFEYIRNCRTFHAVRKYY